MTFTATPQPSNDPPRVLLEVDADEAGATFTSLTITRNGEPILTQPATGAQTAETFDYLAPFGQSVEYIADGTYLPFVAPTWTETWPNLSAWTGDTGSWSVAAGVASSTTANAAITRTTGTTVQRVNVTDPDYVRLEVLTAADVVVVSVAVTDHVVLTGTSAVSVAGTGSYELNLTAGSATVTGDDGWSATRPYTGTPTKVRFVSLGGTYTQTSSFSTTGNADRIAVASGGNIYALDVNAKLVRKFNSAGVFQTSWSTTGTPSGVAVDSGEAIYVTDRTSSLVRKYTSTGTPGITWSTTGTPLGLGIDSGDAVYVLDETNKRVRKYTNTGTAGITWLVGGTDLTNIAVAPDGSVYVATDPDDDEIEKYTSAGASGTPAFFSAAVGASDILSATNTQVHIGSGGAVDHYTSAGVAAGSTTISPNTGGATATTAASALLVGDTTAKTIRTFTPTTGSVGTVSATPTAASVDYRETTLATLTIDEAWLLHPSSPSLSVSIDANVWRDEGLNVNIESSQQFSAKSSQTLHYPIGRARAVAISHGNRLDDEWVLVLTAPRTEEVLAVQAIVRDQTPLLLRSPESFGWGLPDGFYAVGDVETTRPFAPLSFEERLISLPLTPSDPPVVTQAPERTYADLLLEAASYSELLSLYDTYTDLLSGAS